MYTLAYSVPGKPIIRTPYIMFKNKETAEQHARVIWCKVVDAPDWLLDLTRADDQ